VFNWDYGSVSYPHLIKLVRTVTSYVDGGYYAALIFTGSDFQLLNPFVSPSVTSPDLDIYDVYTTQGVLALTASAAMATFGYGQRTFFTAASSYQTVDGVHTAGQVLAELSGTVYDGDLSCETNSASVTHCLNQSDIITILDSTHTRSNPPNINLYRVRRIWTAPYKFSATDSALFQDDATINTNDNVAEFAEMHRGTHRITTDLTLNWGGDDFSDGNHGVADATHKLTFSVYKFTPSTASTYNYVATCSNRGICNTDNGVCQCFAGYTSDDCSTQNSLSL